jgi:medium-chain acyl-[acyl-carrier-protein] hydrolase
MIPVRDISAKESHWLEFTQLNSSASTRLYCLPYAGGSAAIYRQWHGGVLSGLDIRPIQLPARGRRISERPFERLLSLVAELADALNGDHPFALFGHSMGAIVAFELAREFRRRGHIGPVHLFVSGASAPQLAPNRPPRFRLNRAALIAELRKLGGTPDGVFDNDELLELILPALRADFALMDTYQYQAEPPLSCAISAFAGEQDDEAESARVLEWRAQSTRPFRFRELDGDHFFLRSHCDAIRAAVSTDLEMNGAELSRE